MRTAAEIDAAKAVLTTTDLGAITSEVRQFPPGYVTGGLLKLNTNLQIEVAPIAINIAGKDVRIPETVIIGNEHWVINGVETPRVPGSWYYLYLSSAGQFAVSPNEPVYNALYFAYYHGESQDLRAIGKLYFGSEGLILYVQTNLETAIAEILVASSTYTGEDANYYCQGIWDNTYIYYAAQYLYQAHGGGELKYTEGTFVFGNDQSTEISQMINYFSIPNIHYCGNGAATILKGYGILAFFYLKIYGTSSSYLSNIKISNLKIDDLLIELQYTEHSLFERIYIEGNAALTLHTTTRDCIVQECISTDNNEYPLGISGQRHIINSNRSENTIDLNPGILIGASHSIISHNVIKNCSGNGMNISGGFNIISNNQLIDNGLSYENTVWPVYSYGKLNITGTQNSILNNFCFDNGNLITRGGCEVSSTSPMILDEAAPTASNCTWGFTATGPYEGTGQYRLSKTVAAGTKAYLHLVDNVGAADVHGLIPGTQYEWSGWFKCYSSASGGFQGPRFYQATTAGGATSATAVTIATASWQWVAVTATIYVNATTAYFGFWASASLGSTTYFDVDNLRLFPPGTTNVHNQNYYNGGTDTYDGL